MQAPSAVGFTAKQRLIMFWQHKRPLVLCFISVIGIGILILVLFTVAQVKTFYHKISGDSVQETTQVTNVYTIIQGPNGTILPGNITTNGTVALQSNNTANGTASINGTNTTTTGTTNTTTNSTTTNTTNNTNTTNTVKSNNNALNNNNTLNASNKSNATNDVKKHDHYHHRLKIDKNDKNDNNEQKQKELDNNNRQGVQNIDKQLGWKNRIFKEYRYKMNDNNKKNKQNIQDGDKMRLEQDVNNNRNKHNKSNNKSNNKDENSNTRQNDNKQTKDPIIQKNNKVNKQQMILRLRYNNNN